MDSPAGTPTVAGQSPDREVTAAGRPLYDNLDGDDRDDARVNALEFVLLVLAGIGAGLTGSIAGLASLISYPALLAAGIPPVTANITNTVALVLNSVGSVSASRPELQRQGPRLRRLAGGARPGGGPRPGPLPPTPPGALARSVPSPVG